MQPVRTRICSHKTIAATILPMLLVHRLAKNGYKPCRKLDLVPESQLVELAEYARESIAAFNEAVPGNAALSDRELEVSIRAHLDEDLAGILQEMALDYDGGRRTTRAQMFRKVAS